MRGKPTECSWNGIHYESLTQAATVNSVSVATMKKRIDRGYTCDADVPKRGNRTHKVTYLWNDTLYPDMETMADALYLTPHGVWWRLRQGHTGDASMRGYEGAA